MKIAFIGTGTITSALAPRLEAAGHEIVLGSRTPDSATSPFPVRTHVEAVVGADVVINATPGLVSQEVFAGIGSEALVGMVVIDVSNALTPQYALEVPEGSSTAQKLQELLPQSRVVKTGNTIGANVLADPSLLSGPSNIFLSGDDAAAKDIACRVLGELGWAEESVVDLGGIETARSAELYFAMFLTLSTALGREMNIAVVE